MLPIALLLIVFGFIAGLSIGPPFFILGVGLLVLYPVRRQRRVFWPLLVGLTAFLVATSLSMPLWCTARGAVDGGSETFCSNLLGQRWSGSGVFNPPPEARDGALRMGVVAGAIAALTTLLVLSVRGPDARRAAGRPGPAS